MLSLRIPFIFYCRPQIPGTGRTHLIVAWPASRMCTAHVDPPVRSERHIITYPMPRARLRLREFGSRAAHRACKLLHRFVLADRPLLTPALRTSAFFARRDVRSGSGSFVVLRAAMYSTLFTSTSTLPQSGRPISIPRISDCVHQQHERALDWQGCREYRPAGMARSRALVPAVVICPCR